MYNSLSKQFVIADSHNDFIAKLPPDGVSGYLSGEVRECGVKLITAALCCNDKQGGFYTAENLASLFEPLKGFAKQNNSASGMNNHKKQDRTKDTNYRLQDAGEIEILTEYEGLDFLTKNNLDILDKAKPFSVTLTWNGDNALAGGCRSGTNKGISPFGHDVLKLLTERKIAIDTAHLNRKSFYDLIDRMPEGSVCNSHTCIADLFTDNLIMERNITSEQASLIIERGGFIGITLIPYFLCGNETEATPEDAFRHIDFIVQKFGTDNIGIGSDFYGAVHYPKGISNYYGYHSIVKVMENHGYPHENIQKILFDNYSKFCKRQKHN